MNSTLMVQVLIAMRAAITAEVRAPGLARLTLSVALSPHPYVMRSAYDLPTMSR